MYDTNYYRQVRSQEGAEEKVPIKWMALESIETHVFNESTDVVSQNTYCDEVAVLAYFCQFSTSGHLE